MPKKKSPLKKAKDKAQKKFNGWIRLRDCYETTGAPFSAICCTCDKETENDGNLAAGHFILDSPNGNSTSFDEHNVHSQCSHYCNRRMHGNLASYASFIVKKYGVKELDRLNRLKLQNKKWTIEELEEIYLDYKERVKHFQSS